MKTRFVVVAAALAATLAVAAAVPAAASSPRRGAPRTSASAIDAAVAWLGTQQQPDGGFEVSAFPGFETPDAILALAAAAQTGAEWSHSEALAAVEATTTDGGADPLDAVDDWVDSVQGGATSTTGDKAQQAAKVIALVTVPLGLDAADFDPSDDTTGAVDLEAALTAAAGPSGDYSAIAAFTGRVFALWAIAALDGAAAPAALVTAIEDAQQDNGGFSYTGDPTNDALDPDVTGATVIALAADGRGEEARARALSLLGRTQTWTGDWASEFDTGNPNSTAMAMLAARAVGCDPTQPHWRAHADARLSGVPYPSPQRALERRQAGDGHIAGPSDTFGVNTFGTTQAIQALATAQGSWPYGKPSDCPAVVTDQDLANAYYFDLLGRLSDAAGATHWSDQLAGGVSPSRVARAFTGTGEYGRRVTGLIYRSHLDRPPTPAEASEGAAVVLGGGQIALRATVLGSAEYFDLAGPTDDPTTDEEWVDAVYLDALGRAADPGGRAWALGQLDTGRSRTQVASALLRSNEGLRGLVTAAYHELLRRQPDAGGAGHWVGQLRAGRSPEVMVASLAGSAEYVALSTPVTI